MNWYNEEGNNENFKAITSQGSAGGAVAEWKLLNNINADCQQAGKPVYFVSKCTGTFQTYFLEKVFILFSDLCEER